MCQVEYIMQKCGFVDLIGKVKKKVYLNSERL